MWEDVGVGQCVFTSAASLNRLKEGVLLRTSIRSGGGGGMSEIGGFRT